jgi:hypothetical protein
LGYFQLPKTRRDHKRSQSANPASAILETKTSVVVTDVQWLLGTNPGSHKFNVTPPDGIVQRESVARLAGGFAG